MDPRFFLTIAAILFVIGLYGVLTRRNAIGILVSVELLANAANINLVTFARYGAGTSGEVFTLFSIALTVTEVVVGLAIIVLLARTHKDALVELASEMKQ